MKRLAWIEILNTQGIVSARHAVEAWPAHIGRAYTSDVVLDDPHIAANQLEVHPPLAEGYPIKNIATGKGFKLNAQRGVKQDATVSADDVIHVGQTRLRIRPVDYVVAPDHASPRYPHWRSWLGLLIGVLLLVFENVLVRWLDYDHDESYKMMILNVIDQTSWSFALTWVAFWSLLSRIELGRMNVLQHSAIASLGAGCYLLLADMSGYIGFALNSTLIAALLSNVVQPLVIGALLYGHIRQIIQMKRLKLAMWLLLLMVSSQSLTVLKEVWYAENDLGRMPYSRIIGSQWILLTHGKSTEEFIRDAQKLKANVDEPSDK